MVITKIRCQAKNPATCWKHGVVAEVGSTADSIRILLETAKQKENNSNKHSDAKKIVNQALTSNLKWEGDKPSWWGDYKEELESHPQLPCTPELIDIIDTPEGKMAVIWNNEDSTQAGLNLNSGYGTNICYFKSFETGKKYAHLRAAFISEESLERSFGDDEFMAFRWEDRYGSSYYDFEEGDDEVRGERNLQGEELLKKRREVWLAAVKHSSMLVKDKNGNFIRDNINVEEENTPDDITVKKDLETFSNKIKETIDMRSKYFKTPYVDYSSLDDSLQRKGYGSALYVYMARMLAKQGKALRGSGLQSDQAIKVWDNFKENFPQNVKEIALTFSRTSEEDILPILDFIS